MIYDIIKQNLTKKDLKKILSFPLIILKKYVSFCSQNPFYFFIFRKAELNVIFLGVLLLFQNTYV